MWRWGSGGGEIGGKDEATVFTLPKLAHQLLDSTKTYKLVVQFNSNILSAKIVFTEIVSLLKNSLLLHYWESPMAA